MGLRASRLLLGSVAAAALLLAGLAVQHALRFRALQSAEAQWQALGIRDYVFHIRVQCFCQYAGTAFRITVRDAKIAAVAQLDHPDSPLRAAAAREVVTVDTLFRWLDAAYRSRWSRVHVRYSERYHFPEEARVDGGTGTDGEWAFVVEHFVPSGARSVSGAGHKVAEIVAVPGAL